MRLYLVGRTDCADWDEHHGAVIAAKSEDAARSVALAPHTADNMNDWLYGFTADNITVTQISARTAEPAGVVLASFNAG